MKRATSLLVPHPGRILSELFPTEGAAEGSVFSMYRVDVSLQVGLAPESLSAVETRSPFRVGKVGDVAWEIK